MSQHSATVEERFIKLHHYSEKHYDAWPKGFNKEKNKLEYNYDSDPKTTKDDDWNKHLHGVKHLTVVPWKSAEEFNCIFGVIDVDVYNDPKLLEELKEKAKEYKGIPVYSVSGGLQLWFYFEKAFPVPDVRSHLTALLKIFKLPKNTEIFPKNKKPTKKGNGIKAPCCGFLKPPGVNYGKLYSHVDQAENNLITQNELKTSESVTQENDKKKPKQTLDQIKTKLLIELTKDDEVSNVDEMMCSYIGKAVYDGISIQEIKDFLTKHITKQHGTGTEFDTVEEYIDDKIERVSEAVEENNKKGKELLERVVYMAQSDKWFDKKKNQIYTEKSIDAQFGHYFAKQKTRPSTFIKSRSDKIVVEDFCYEPKLYKPDNSIIEKEGLFYINKYQPHTLEAIPGDISLYEELIEHLFDTLEAQTVFEDWVSYNYQYPGEKIKWALLITTSYFQIGKGSLFRAIQETLGYNNTRKIDVREALDKSKLFLTDRQIVLLDEMKSEGKYSERETLLNSLKIIITEEDQSSRALFQDYKAIKTCTNLILFSNFSDALSISEKEERYWVHHTNVPRLSEKFYEAFHKWLDGQGKNHLLHHFKTREISESFNPKGTAPKTKYLKTMSRLGDHPLINQLRDRFEQQLEPFESDRELMSSTWLFEWCKKKNILGRSRLNEISKALETVGGMNMGQCPIQRATPDGHRIHKPTIWIVRNHDHWKHQKLEDIGEAWANDPFTASIDIFGGTSKKDNE